MCKKEKDGTTVLTFGMLVLRPSKGGLNEECLCHDILTVSPFCYQVGVQPLLMVQQ